MLAQNEGEQMTWKVAPERYAFELVIAGIVGALVKSNAVKVQTLEDHVLVPLRHHMMLFESYKEKSTTEEERVRNRDVSFECMTWHAYMENVFNALK